MPSLHLTKAVIDRIPFTESGQLFFRDNVLRGFALRVGQTSKVFVVEGQANRTTRRVTIGRADVIPPEVARRKALVILGEMAEGLDPNRAKRERRAEGITVDQAFDNFFAAKKLSASAIDNYRRTQRKYLADWSQKKIVEISRQMILARHQRVSEEFGPVTANNVCRHFRSIFNFTAAGFDEFPPNPVTILTQARSWHRETRRQRVITVADLPAWWRAVHAEHRDARDIFLVAIFTGMRRSEIVRLEWEHLDFVGRKLHLSKTKNGDSLDLPMSTFLSDLLAARREWAGQSRWVFPGSGDTGHIVEVKSFVRRVVESSGVAFSMHDLRRTFVTIAESLDINTYSLKRLLNHRVTDVTGGYIIANVERLRQPVERVAAKILEIVNAESEGKSASSADAR